MSTDKKQDLIIVLLLIVSLFSVSANPFLGSTDSKPVPAVRPPSSGGFMIEKQLEFRDLIGDRLKTIGESENKSLLWGILGLAFLYGMLHAAGPGHRKTVIFSMFLTRKARWGEPMLAALLSSSVHGGTALVLILLFQFLFSSLKSTEINNVSSYLEGISYLFLLVFTLWFIIRNISGIVKKTENHHYNNENTGKGIYMTLLVSSFFPCPGVIMIMTFSAALGVLTMGIYAVIALSFGMGITISLAGYLAYFGRESIFLFFKGREKTIGHISTALELGSFVFLFLFSFWMAYPFISTILNRI